MTFTDCLHAEQSSFNVVGGEACGHDLVPHDKFEKIKATMAAHLSANSVTASSRLHRASWTMDII